MKNTGHVTVENTAKKFKLIKILCWLVYIAAIIMYVSSDGLKLHAIFIFAAALILSLVNRFLIWWNHG